MSVNSTLTHPDGYIGMFSQITQHWRLCHYILVNQAATVHNVTEHLLWSIVTKSSILFIDGLWTADAWQKGAGLEVMGSQVCPVHSELSSSAIPSLKRKEVIVRHNRQY